MKLNEFLTDETVTDISNVLGQSLSEFNVTLENGDIVAAEDKVEEIIGLLVDKTNNPVGRELAIISLMKVLKILSKNPKVDNFADFVIKNIQDGAGMDIGEKIVAGVKAMGLFHKDK